MTRGCQEQPVPRGRSGGSHQHLDTEKVFYTAWEFGVRYTKVGQRNDRIRQALLCLWGALDLDLCLRIGESDVGRSAG